MNCYLEKDCRSLPMTSIDDFIKNEERKMTWVDKITRNYPRIRQTSSIALPASNKSLPGKTVIKPAVPDKVISTIILIFLALIWVGLLRLVLTIQFPFVVVLLSFLFISFLILLVANNAFFNKKYIYTLMVDSGGINIDDRKIPWSSVKNTFIMNRQEGKTTNYYLLIL